MELVLALAPAYGAFELALAWSRRSHKASGTARVADEGSLMRIWLAIAVAMSASVAIAWLGPPCLASLLRNVRYVAIATFAAGLGVRLWAIATLGRMFTVDVAILDGHRLVTSGPYRWLRHPSYTGVVLAVLGLGALSQNAISMSLATSTTVAVLVHRIRIEERALAAAFGDAWRAHCARTWRLVPLVW